MILRVCRVSGEDLYSIMEVNKVIEVIKGEENVILSYEDNEGCVCDILDKNNGVYHIEEDFYKIKNKSVMKVLSKVMYKLNIFLRVG